MRTKSGIAKKGFTLVEVMIIAPIVVLAIGAFIGLVINLTGDSLKLREKNTGAYDVQAALDDMEINVNHSTTFLSTTGTLTVPQGKSDTGGAFSDASGTGPFDTLIFQSVATTTNLYDVNRSIIYTGTGSCSANNTPFQYETVYFVDSGSLYKRTIVPSGVACAVPWQKNTCSAAGLASNPSLCKAEDDKLLDNVASFGIQFYNGATSGTAVNQTAIAGADTVSISITLSKPIAGTTASYSASLRATSLNSHATDSTQTVNTPSISAAFSDISNPYKATFSWQGAGNASGYNIRYRITNSGATAGAWTNGPQGTSATTYDVSGTARKQTLEIEVTAVSAAGNYLYGTKSIAVSNWNDCTLQNSWSNYGGTGFGGYNEAGFTKTTSGLVGLKGLVAGGTVGYTSPVTNAICTLPVGFRPQARLIFTTGSYNPFLTNGRGPARVDIDTDGTVSVITGSNTWVSLDGIIFATSTAGISWTNVPLANSWYYNNYGINYGVPQYGFDSMGRVQVQGLATTTGAVNNDMVIGMPANTRPGQVSHYHVDPGQVMGGGVNIDYTVAGNMFSRSNTGTYRSLQLMYYPASKTGWTNLSLQNGWAAYGSIFTTPQCIKAPDDVVTVKGLITGGNVNFPAVITNLASCGVPNANGGTFYMNGLAYNSSGGGDAQASFDLDPSGNVIVTNANVTWSSLDNFTYIAN
jgi:hypothetical protein